MTLVTIGQLETVGFKSRFERQCRREWGDRKSKGIPSIWGWVTWKHSWLNPKQCR